MLPRFFYFLSVLLLTGCASYTRIVDTWPAELPPADYFVAAYEQDLDNQKVQSLRSYLIWVKRFYQGWVVYEKGWLPMSEDLVSRIDDHDKKSEAAAKIAEIGLRISPEWAKDKDDRYILTSTISEWGESLLESLSRGDSLELMDSVMADITLLERGQLAPEEITIERYFPDLKIDEDDDFFF